MLELEWAVPVGGDRTLSFYPQCWVQLSRLGHVAASLGAELPAVGLHPPRALPDAPGLPFRFAGERARELHRGVEIREDRVERLPRGRGHRADALGRAPALLHRLQHLADLLLGELDAGAHLARRARALLRQLAHLVRHDAEPEPVRSGPRRLDGRVEREQVGLARDARDRVHELADLARPLFQRAGRPRYLIEICHERHEQLARAGDLLAVAARLLGDGVDLPLRFLSAEVQLRCDPRRLLRILTAVADELPLAFGAGGELLGGRRDLLRRGLQLLSRRRELLSHGGEVVGLPLNLTHRHRDRLGGAVDAHAQVAQLVALGVLQPDGEIPPLDLRQHLAGCPQAAHDLRQHGHEGGAAEDEDERLLQVERPGPPAAPLAQRGEQGEAGEVQDERLPRSLATEPSPATRAVTSSATAIPTTLQRARVLERTYWRCLARASCVSCCSRAVGLDMGGRYCTPRLIRIGAPRWDRGSPRASPARARRTGRPPR